MHGPETWWVICPKCGRERNAAEAGIVRYGARSKGKRILGKCSACQRWVFARLEQRLPERLNPER